MNDDILLTPQLPDSVFTDPAKFKTGDDYIAKNFPDLINHYSSTLGLSDSAMVVAPKGPFFQEKPWHVRPMDTAQRTENMNDWVLPVLLICFAILAWVRVSYYKRFTQLVQASYSRQYMNLLLREGGGSFDMINLSLGLVYIGTMAMLLFQLSEWSSGPGSFPFLVFLSLTGGIILWLLFRLFLIRMLSWTFKTSEITSFYLMNSMAFHFLTGIFILPLLVINAYAPSSFILYLGLGFAGMLFILRLFRGIIIGLSDTKFSIFYLFFYLCTVEILPLLVIVKFAKESL